MYEPGRDRGSQAAAGDLAAAVAAVVSTSQASVIGIRRRARVSSGAGVYRRPYGPERQQRVGDHTARPRRIERTRSDATAPESVASAASSFSERRLELVLRTSTLAALLSTVAITGIGAGTRWPPAPDHQRGGRLIMVPGWACSRCSGSGRVLGGADSDVVTVFCSGDTTDAIRWRRAMRIVVVLAALAVLAAAPAAARASRIVFVSSASVDAARAGHSHLYVVTRSGVGGTRSRAALARTSSGRFRPTAVALPTRTPGRCRARGGRCGDGINGGRAHRALSALGIGRRLDA